MPHTGAARIGKPQHFFVFVRLLFQHNLLQLRPRASALGVSSAAKPFILGIMNGSNNGSGPGNPPVSGNRTMASSTVRVEGTNVVRVPFGVRQARRAKPQRPDHWATLVLPFHGGGGQPTPPPQAA